MNTDDKKKDPRITYEHDKDVKYQRKPYADNDVIDRPVNQARRYEIKKAGVPYKEGHKPEDFHEVPVDAQDEVVKEIDNSEKERMENKE